MTPAAAAVAATLISDAVLYSLAGSLAFLGAVVLFDPKLRKTSIGKSLIMVDAGLGALYLPSVLHRFLHVPVSQRWFLWYYLATLVVVGTGTWWRTCIMVAVQWRHRRTRRSRP